MSYLRVGGGSGYTDKMHQRTPRRIIHSHSGSRVSVSTCIRRLEDRPETRCHPALVAACETTISKLSGGIQRA